MLRRFLPFSLASLFVLGVAAACSSSSSGSYAVCPDGGACPTGYTCQDDICVASGSGGVGGGSGGSGAGGSGGSAVCSPGVDCSGCSGCIPQCQCLGGSVDQCTQGCAAATGGTAGVGGTGGTGAVGGTGGGATCQAGVECEGCPGCFARCVCLGGTSSVCNSTCGGGTGGTGGGSSCAPGSDCSGCLDCMSQCTCVGGDQQTCIETCFGGTGGTSGTGGSGGTGGGCTGCPEVTSALGLTFAGCCPAEPMATGCGADVSPAFALMPELAVACVEYGHSGYTTTACPSCATSALGTVAGCLRDYDGECGYRFASTGTFSVDFGCIPAWYLDCQPQP